VPARADYLVHDASAASVLFAVFTGTTVSDGHPSLRGAAAAYRTSARNAFLRGNRTDPMHGRNRQHPRVQPWTSLRDEPSQERPREEETGSHAPPLRRRIGRHNPNTAKGVPAEPGTSNATDDPSRKVTSPETVNFMKCCGQNQ
jgi:hypothetical protein